MTKTTAELMIREDEYKGTFEIKTYFRGDLCVRLFSVNGDEVCLIELGELDEVFTKERGFQRDNKGLFRISRGECKAKYGVEQKIELKQRPIQ